MGKGGARGWLAFGLIGTASILDLAGTDLVLPSVPSLPDALGGTPADAQLVLAAYVAGMSRLMPQTARRTQAGRAQGGYRRLIGDPVFLRYALSQAFVLGGLLTFVFGMPAVFVRALGGSVGDFIVMQITGIVAFMLAANLVGGLLPRFGAERVIGFGTLIAAAGAATMLLYGLAGGTDPMLIAALFVPVNAGLGLRGPPGFFRAVVAAQGDDARGSALVILKVLGVTAAGTAIAAPLIEQGLVPLAAIALALHVAAVLCLAFLPKLREGNRQEVPLA